VSASHPARPQPDEDSASFWAAASEHRIVLQQCQQCREIRFPPMPGCPNCGSPDFHEVESPGSGRIYSWIVVHRALAGLGPDQVPRTIATVELDEGCRVIGRVVGGGEPGIDKRVRPTFVDHDEWTEIAFELGD
jgi:uncharacterized protein